MNARYTLRDTASGYGVFRANGDYAEFDELSRAEGAFDRLTAGDDAESEYDWTTP